MGMKEFKNIIHALSDEERLYVSKYSCSKKFRFGPSRVYQSSFRARIPLRLSKVKVMASFYIIEGEIPVLLGNDVLEALGGVIHTNERKVEFRRLGISLKMRKTNGGHYVLPITQAKSFEEDIINDYYEIPDPECGEIILDKNGNDDIKGDEADAVLLVMLSECHTTEDLIGLHEIIGHTNFVALGLEVDEKKEVEKVHRYFGHKSGRRTWDLNIF